MKNIQNRILNNLKVNGFPEKKVALPFPSILKACNNARVKLTDVLKGLEKMSVFHTLKDNKIIFHKEETEIKNEDKKSENPFMKTDGVFKKVIDKMDEMSPEQLNSIYEKVMNMSPEEREKMMKLAEKYK